MMLALLAGSLLLTACAKAVPPPSQDAFYTQPSTISSYAPGAIIDVRVIPTNINSLFPSKPNITVDTAYQYLYRTTDSLGNAVAAVTTLMVPYNADPSKLLSYQTAYDSSNNDCSPSYALRAGANTTGLLDVLLITAALDKGWYVVTSDYEGLEAQYVAGVQSGYATLDSVRAVFNAAPINGLSSKARYAMYGYSGGSLASEWAAELQPGYAPELSFAGIGMGGLIPNTSSVLETINKGYSSGIAFSGIDGLSKAYPDLKTWLDQNLVASKKAEFYSIAAGCLSDTMSTGANKDIYSYFIRGQQSLYDAVPQSVLNASGAMGQHGIPTAPLFIHKAIADEISPSKDTDELVARYCNQHDVAVNIEYHKDVVGNHATEAITGSGSALEWVADRLDGVQVKGAGCVAEYVALTSVDLGTSGVLGGVIVAVLQDLLGGRLGPVIVG